MESIIPWEMFSYGVTAEETDEILTDEVLNEHQTQVKQEPEELLPDNSAYQSERNLRKNASKTTAVAVANTDDDDEDDDNTIFQFDFDTSQTPVHQQQKQPHHQQQQQQQREREQQRTPTINEMKRGPAKFSDTDAHINFEAAVIYICPACGAEFDTQDSWKRHLNGVHSYNTLRGLNFVKVNQLYHECLQCDRHIAKHAMENLLKHKFTHLPYRCTKCRFCFREYKYRQDLIIHLRITHRDDVVALTYSSSAQNVPSPIMPVSKSIKTYANNTQSKEQSKPALEIMDIKENAIDIYENTCDDIPVKNELIEPDENDVELITDHMQDTYTGPSFIDDGQSCSSSRVAEWQDETKLEKNLLDKYVQFICPQCGIEYESERNWNEHVEKLHKYNSCEGLNFSKVNENGCAQCLECKKAIYMHSIRNLQLHKFSHLPYKSWLRCNLCQRSYVGQREIVRHLMTQHNIDSNGNANEVQTASSNTAVHDMISGGVADDNSQEVTGMDTGDNDVDNNNPASDSYQIESTTKNDVVERDRDRDIYEKHIDYLCPQCGKEFGDKKLWRAHTVRVHFLTDLKVLNYKKVSHTELMCVECMKRITNAYGIQNALQHAITHMPYKAYIRCRICAQSYTERKGLVKHLRKRHNIGDSNGDMHVSGSGDNSNNGTVNEALSYARAIPPLQPLPMSTSMKRRQPVKEIVRHADVTFEIQYLDDDEGDDNANVPELSYDGANYEAPLQWSRHKCVDCGSIFSTQQALQTHEQEEHEFLDYDNTNNSKKQKMEIIPTINNEDDDYSNSSNSNSAMNKYNASSRKQPERHFCYLCPACGKEFRIQSVWRCHINEVHHFDNRHVLNFHPLQKFRYQCNECHTTISNTKLKCLQEHKFRHLPYRLYLKCRYCGMCYNHKPNLRTHLRVRHNIVEVEPVVTEIQINMSAPATTTTSSLLSSKPQIISTVGDCISYHNAVDHPSVTYFCPECNQQFDTHVFWRKHIVEVHKLNSVAGLNFRKLDNHHYLCLQCYKRVTVTHTKGAIGQLQSHKFRHLPYRAFKCISCNDDFVRKQMFFKHLNRRTNRCKQDTGIVLPDDVPKNTTSGTGCGYSLKCPQCGQSYKSWWQWRKHINECIDCGKRVASSNFFDLQTHRFKHLPHGKYLQCNVCAATFMYVSDIQKHLKDNHQEIELEQMDDSDRQLAEEQMGEEVNEGSLEVDMTAQIKPDLSTMEQNGNDGNAAAASTGGKMQNLLQQVPQLEAVEAELNALNQYSSLAVDAPFLLD